jgi:hypothetical protein
LLSRRGFQSEGTERSQSDVSSRHDDGSSRHTDTSSSGSGSGQFGGFGKQLVLALEQSGIKYTQLEMMKQHELAVFVEKELSSHIARTMHELLHPSAHAEDSQGERAKLASTLSGRKNLQAIRAQFNVQQQKRTVERKEKQTTRSKYRQVLADLIGPPPPLPDEDPEEGKVWQDDFIPAMKEGMIALGQDWHDPKFAYRHTLEGQHDMCEKWGQHSDKMAAGFEYDDAGMYSCCSHATAHTVLMLLLMLCSCYYLLLRLCSCYCSYCAHATTHAVLILCRLFGCFILLADLSRRGQGDRGV